MKAFLVALMVPWCVAGCGNFSSSIQTRVEVAEKCRQALQTPAPENSAINPELLTLKLGDVGRCSVQLGKDEQLLSMCSFESIYTKYGWPDTRFTAVRDARNKIGTSLTNLHAKLKHFNRRVEAANSTLREAERDLRTNSPGDSKLTPQQRFVAMSALAQDLHDNVDQVKDELKALRGAIVEFRVALSDAYQQMGEQGAIELTAWGSNLEAQVSQIEQLLMGDYRIVLTDTLRDRVIHHVAKRSLELLHNSLKPAQAVINRLDDKYYGAASISFLAFEPQLQDAVNRSFAQVKAVYARRIESGGLAANANVNVSAYLTELRRAACDNLSNDGDLPMLSELVDTMLILNIEKDKEFQPAKSEPPKAELNVLQKWWASVRAPGSAPAQVQAATATLDGYWANVSVGENSTKQTTPLNVYTANQWASRQQLLVDAITAQRRTLHDEARKIAPVPVSVDERKVRQLADIATAKSVDDAVRESPALLAAAPGDVALTTSLVNNVNVSSAASAVAQASATLNAQLSMQNVSTFSPTNTIAPVFNVNTLPAPQPDHASLCAEAGMAQPGVSCMKEGTTYVISLTPPTTYLDDSCTDQSVEDKLTGIGKSVAEYGTRNDVVFLAQVSGYASRPVARLKNCPARPSAAAFCSYRNRAWQQVPVAGCREGERDLNRLLSAGRAQHAASTLERAAGSAALVKELVAFGAGRPSLFPPYEDSRERTVVLRLRPVVTLM